MPDQRSLRPHLVREVINYGGFFGGDTISLTASPLDAPDEQSDFTIAEHDIENLQDKYQIVEGVVLGLAVDGGEVRRARVLAAPTRDALYGAARVEAAGTGPTRVRASRCPACQLWIEGMPDGVEGGNTPTCRLCGGPLNGRRTNADRRE